jgi:hypothetical protein
VIRANLLPRPKETFGAFGVEFDADYVRQTIVGSAIVFVVTLLGLGVEQVHIARLRVAAEGLEAAIVLRAPERAESKNLALDVARYQEFAREAQLSRRSGPEAAIEIAHIGNDIPKRVWLEGLAHADTGYELTGGALSVDVVGNAILSLTHAVPSGGASLVSVENRALEGVRFDAHVGSSATAAGSSGDGTSR